jgi:hypothetical protein
MSGQEIDGEQGSSSSDCFSSEEDDCPLIKNKSSDEDSDATPRESDVQAANRILHPNPLLLQQPKQQDQAW